MATKHTQWDKLPAMSEDVVSRGKKDISAIRKGMGAGASGLHGTAQDVAKEAGARGITRMAGRAVPAVAVLQGGYDLGREIDERTGAGKKMVEGSGALRGIADKMGASDRAKLSESAKERIADMENDKALREVDAEREASKYGKGDEAMKRGGKVKAYAKGGSVSASSRGDGIATKGKTRGRYL